MTGRLSFLHLAGNPLECGRAHGRRARPAIAHNVALYLRRFQEDGRIDHDEIWRRASQYQQLIERENPAYAAEMRGIAEGARQDLLDVPPQNAIDHGIEGDPPPGHEQLHQFVGVNSFFPSAPRVVPGLQRHEAGRNPFPPGHFPQDGAVAEAPGGPLPQDRLGDRRLVAQRLP